MKRNEQINMLLAELNKEHLKQLGDEPNIENLEAYLRDELPEGAEKERVRAMLVAYPELASSVALWPDEEDHPSDEDVEQRWAAMRQRVGIRGRVLPFRSALQTIAATLALVFGALYGHAQWRLTRPTVVWDETLLSPDGRRGGTDTAVALTPAGNSFFMVVPLIGEAAFDEYRLAIVDDRHTLWHSATLRRSADDSFAILVPRSFLDPGTYQVVLYGKDGPKEEKLATYSVRVPAP
jgi:hypothetical protein